ncbi:MAG: DUF885 domain-containing protein [Calditrichaeota bacterium]|nr:DUF885 domain-containing protein [Calditrichota bacterium]
MRPVWIILVLLLAFGTQLARTPAQNALHQLFNEAWEYQLKENPLFATMVGVHKYNDRLPSVRPEDFVRSARKLQEFLDRLQAIDRQALPREDQINYDIFKWQLENYLAEFQFNTHLMPITQRGGFHVQFPQLPRRVPLKTVKDYENYIARLRAFAPYAQQHIQLMREGMRRGYTLPRILLKGVEETLRPHLVDQPEKSLLYEPFRNMPDHFPEDVQKRLREQGRKAIEESVLPGFRQFYTFVKEEYTPAARESIGARDLPNGKAFYRHRVRYFTTLDMDPEAIHEIGLQEVRRIRQEMEAIIQELQFDGTLQDFIQFLRTDPRFYVDTPEELLKEVAYVLKRMDGELPRLFKTLPRMPYGIRPVPDFLAPRATTAYYNRPAGDGTRAGFYYVNTYDLKSRPLYEIEALSFHEAVPGHHLQLALQQELPDLPPFRRFGGFTVFVEGWALYAERLGLEVGFYQDPYSNFGRLTYEMWRACRLVVDTGIHYLGWTRQQAIDFMAENTALTLLNIENEVDRYISWPGQALGYKIGELKIRELRQWAETQLGDAFDIREFHDVVLLDGSIPLYLLEENVKAWVQQVQQKKGQ